MQAIEGLGMSEVFDKKRVRLCAECICFDVWSGEPIPAGLLDERGMKYSGVSVGASAGANRCDGCEREAALHWASLYFRP